MRRAVPILLALLLAGCSSTTPPPATSPPPASTPTPATVASTPVGTTPATLATPTAPTAPGPAPVAAGAAFERATLEEPPAPRPELMRATPAGEWTLRVEGDAGAVPAGAKLLVAELGLARGVLARAGTDGSFAAEVSGAPGSWVHVALLPDGLLPGATITETTTGILHARGSAYVRAAPDAPVSVTGHAPGGQGYAFSGDVTDEGGQVRVKGAFRLLAEGDVDGVLVSSRLARAFDAQGEPVPLSGSFATAFRTPSGLPLERLTRGTDPTLSAPSPCAAVRESARTLRCDVDLVSPTQGLPDGGWLARLFVQAPGVPHRSDQMESNGRAYLVEEGAPLKVLPRGVPAMRLAAMLFVDTTAQTDRGVQADGDAWGWSNQIAWQAPLHVMPRRDATGMDVRYLWTPYLPQLGITDRDAPSPPMIDLDPSSVSWKVRVQPPAGEATQLEASGFSGFVSRTATTSQGDLLDNGGANVNGVLRPAGRDDALRAAFSQDGLHVITVEGSARDRDGHAYRLGGTYRVLVAEPMDLDLGMLPGTPLETGAYVDRAVQTHPPLPADVTYRFRAWTGPDAALTIDETTRGRASAFGWVHPHAGHPIRPMEAGEYRVDVFANATDAQGRLWAAAWSFGGVIVDPAAAIETHGRPGVDLLAQDLPRFTRSQTGLAPGGNHMNLPYHGGDVAWQTDDDAMKIQVTVADPGRAFAPLLEARAQGVTGIMVAHGEGPEQPGFGEDVVPDRYAKGLGPLFSATASGRDALFGEPLDLQAYAYAAIERPGVRVREQVREDLVPRAYWRFGEETYALQPGVGANGDGENDYKLMFAGSVVRAPGAGVLRTGGYASLWIDAPLPESRVGSAFDPASPPLFRVDGRDVRAFYDPTGVRPGTLLVEGDVADFGGYLVPLGPQRVWLNVTSPSGKTRAFEGQANPWGFLHDPAMNFVVDEAGVWRVDVRLRACPPPRDAAWPCVDGGLTTGATSYAFYVASRDAAPLGVDLPAFVAGDLDLAVPGVSSGHATAWMPGWLLDTRDAPAGGPLLRHRPAELAAKYPNFEAGPVDQVTLTALAKDAGGAWRGLAVETWGTRVVG